MKKALNLSAIAGLAILVIFSNCPAFGQYDAFRDLQRDIDLIKFREANRMMNYQEVSGNPYYTNDYVRSMVYLVNGDSAVAKLRFDLFANEVEFMKDNFLMWAPKFLVKMISFGDEKLIVSKVPGKKDPVFLFLIRSGKYSLCLHKEVEFLPAEPIKAYADPVPPRFEPKRDVYYIMEGSNECASVMTKKELELLVAGNAAARDFLKKEKIKAGKEDDLVKLVDFLNSREWL